MLLIFLPTSKTEQDYFAQYTLDTDLKKRAVNGAGFAVFSRISTYGIQLVGTFILARMLRPEDFGLVAMITVISGILIEFGTLRLADATIQREEINHHQISTLFWINFSACLLLALVLIACSPLIQSFYSEPRLRLITYVIALGFVFSGSYTQHLALLQRKLEFLKILKMEVSATLISTCFAISIALIGGKYWAIVGRQVILTVTMAIGAWHHCKWRPGLPRYDSQIGSMLKFGMNSFGNYFMSYLTRNIDKLLIGKLYNPQLLGYYERAYHLFVMPVNQLSYPLTSVAVATLSRVNKSPDEFKAYYFKSILILGFLGMLLSTILTCIGNDIIILLLGDQWTKAGQVFTMFAPSIGIMLIYATHGWLHLSLGNSNKWFRWSLFASIVSLVSILIGLKYGITGVALGYTISCYILIGPGLSYAGSPIGIRFRMILKIIWRFLAAGLLTGILWWYLIHNVSSIFQHYLEFHILIRVLMTVLFCCFIYLISIIILYASLSPIIQVYFFLKSLFRK